jgi:adenylate kinase
MRLILLGPQGAGKGTQAQRLAAHSGARHLAMGDLVRAEIAAGTVLGRRLQGYHDRGELIPLEIVAGMARTHLRGLESWILDGFPRTEAQARALERMLEEECRALDGVVSLQAPDALLVERLCGRRQSAATGRTYHLLYDPPGSDDPGPFLQRPDDTPRAIRRRLAIYHAETEPLKRYYRQRGLLVCVDASGPIATVTAAILAALDGAWPSAAVACAYAVGCRAG